MSPDERLRVARRRVALWRRRAIVRVRHAQGLSDEEIAAEVGCSVRAVRRDVSYVRRTAGDPPVTPSLLIDRRTIGEIDTPTLLGALAAWPYTESIYAPEWVEGVIPGSWADITQARFDGSLTQTEYESLLPFRPGAEGRTIEDFRTTEPERDQLESVVEALHDHLAVRNSADAVEPPSACSCAGWDATADLSWQEHVALELVVQRPPHPNPTDAMIRRFRAVIALLGDEDITPTGRRQMERVLEAINAGDGPAGE